MRLFKKKKSITGYGWFGNYSSWEEANSLSGGYDQANILEKTTQALLAVKNGEARYERDSVLFEKSEYPYPLLSFLLQDALQRKRPVNVLDFGGSLGSTYFQLKEFLTPEVCSCWSIVEQRHYVERGKDLFENDTLKFFYSINDCIASAPVDLVILSSVVQYLPSPHRFLDELVSWGFDTIILDRTAFINEGTDRITVQRVWPSVYDASYPAWFFGLDGFIAHFQKDYLQCASFDSYVQGESIMYVDNQPAGYSKGFCFKKRK